MSFHFYSLHSPRCQGLLHPLFTRAGAIEGRAYSQGLSGQALAHGEKEAVEVAYVD